MDGVDRQSGGRKYDGRGERRSHGSTFGREKQGMGKSSQGAEPGGAGIAEDAGG